MLKEKLTEAGIDTVKEYASQGSGILTAVKIVLYAIASTIVTLPLICWLT